MIHPITTNHVIQSKTFLNATSTWDSGMGSPLLVWDHLKKKGRVLASFYFGFGSDAVGNNKSDEISERGFSADIYFSA